MVEILDPAWPARFEVDMSVLNALRDGELGLSLDLQAAQWAVDQGIVCPLQLSG